VRVIHHRVVDVVEDLARVPAEQARIGGIEEFSLEDDSVVIACRAQERAAGQKGSRADLHIQLNPPFGQQGAQRVDPQPVGCLLRIRDNG
jgi:hypothetical protein